MTWGSCHWCGRELQAPTARSRTRKTRDHVLPKRMGGTKTRPCCNQCNQLKGGLHPAEWKRFMARNARYWKAFRRHEDVLLDVRHDRSFRIMLFRIGNQPKWPTDVLLPPRPMCRGLAT